MRKGKFIVFEGLDGSGKSTQAELLIDFLRKKDFKIAKIDFPQYGEKSAGMVEEYLKGKYGSSRKVGPYRASIFYACDRYDASFKIRKWLSQGRIVVSNRYVSSNIGHQGGKIRGRRKRKKYIKWLYNLEYNIFAIPKPDITIFLKTSPILSYIMAPKNIDRDKKKYLKSEIRDVHERNILHLRRAMISYIQFSREFPEKFEVIKCTDKGKMLPPEEIHEMILKVLKVKKII